MRKHKIRFTVVSMSVYMILALATPGLAAYQGRYRGRNYTKSDVDRIIKRVEARSDAFVKLFDDALDKSSLDGTDREDRLNERAKDLEKELDDLRKDFDRSDTWHEVRAGVVEALREAGGINRVVHNRRLTPRVESSWTALRADLNRLAAIYDLPRLK